MKVDENENKRFTVKRTVTGLTAKEEAAYTPDIRVPLT